MDNEAQQKYLIQQDEQIVYVAPVIILTRNVWASRESLRGAIGPSLLEPLWEQVSRGRVIGGEPPVQYRPLPLSEHPGLSAAAFDRLRTKFGRIA